MVTVYDVAQHVGVSIASVSRALNGKPGVSPETVERIRDAADALGYHVDGIARAMVTRTTATVGILVPGLTNPFFPEIVDGFQRAAERADYAVVLAGLSTREDSLREEIAVLRGRRVDGAVVIASSLSTAAVEEAFDGLPTVFLDREKGGSGVTVGVDHEAGAAAAVRHLIELGHRRIAHLAGPEGLQVSLARESGWRRAIAESGASADLMVRADFSEAGAHAAIRQLLDRGEEFSGVFAANDLSAIGALAALRDAGLDVPRDVSVVGFDGISLARYVTPHLTTVAQPIEALGAASFAALRDVMDAHARGVRLQRREILPTELWLGQSTAPPRGHS